MATKEPVKTIDATPTWEGVLGWIIAVIEDGDATHESKKIIKEQLQKMARVADQYVAAVKGEQEVMIEKDGNYDFDGKTLWSQWNNGQIGNFGGFQTKLFQAYREADSGNRARLRAAFPFWFLKQSEEALDRPQRRNVSIDTEVETPPSSNNIPPAVMKALNHVREHYPQVCMVVFSNQLAWQYMDENFNAPKFGSEINTSILEAAADGVDDYPIVYQLPSED